MVDGVCQKGCKEIRKESRKQTILLCPSAPVLAFNFSHSRVKVISRRVRRSFLIEHSAVIGHMFFKSNRLMMVFASRRLYAQ